MRTNGKHCLHSIFIHDLSFWQMSEISDVVTPACFIPRKQHNNFCETSKILEWKFIFNSLHKTIATLTQTVNQLSFWLLLSHTSVKHYEIRTKHTIYFSSDPRLGSNCVKCLVHTDPIILNDFHSKQQSSITWPLWNLHTLSKLSILRYRGQFSLKTSKNTLLHEIKFHNKNTTLQIEHKRSKHSTDQTDIQLPAHSNQYSNSRFFSL